MFVANWILFVNAFPSNATLLILSQFTSLRIGSTVAREASPQNTSGSLLLACAMSGTLFWFLLLTFKNIIMVDPHIVYKDGNPYCIMYVLTIHIWQITDRSGNIFCWLSFTQCVYVSFLSTDPQKVVNVPGIQNCIQIFNIYWDKEHRMDELYGQIFCQQRLTKWLQIRLRLIILKFCHDITNNPNNLKQL